MNSAILTPPAAAPSASQRHQSLLLVFCCTIFGAAAQILIKTGLNHVNRPMDVLTNIPLWAGFSLLGLNTVFLVLALRKGELSSLYPIIALTYVWVTLLSMFIFHESLNPLKAIGVGIIVTGVSVLGNGGGKR